MIIATLKAWFESTKLTLRSVRALSMFAVLDALLLVSLYLFVSTRVATVWQVLITFIFFVLIPAEFFILQASILAHAHDAKRHWRAILISALKLFVVTIPILLIGYVFWILLNKWQLRHLAPRPPIVFPPAAARPQPLHWPTLLFATVRGLLFAVLLPLATIHLWIEVAAHDVRGLFSGGAGGTVKRLGKVMTRAFTSSAVFIYALGLILFALIPYALLFVQISPKGTKTDFAVFIFRLLLVFGFTLFGWIVTLTALAKDSRSESAVSTVQVTTPAEATA